MKTIQEIIADINENNLGSIYSKEDVIRLLESVKETDTFSIDENFLDEIQEDLYGFIENEIEEWIDYSDITLNIDSGNYISVDHIGFREQKMQNSVATFFQMLKEDGRLNIVKSEE